VPAQAKINLRLRILAREASGFHQLETILLRLTLADEVTVRTSVRGRTLDCRGADVGPLERNLAYRAAMALREAGGPDTFAIEIEKQIPVGAGLGGGSADAAAVLRALNGQAARPLPDDGLLAIAASLGADVPFLASRAVMALAWGRGERLLALDPPPSRPVVVLVPAFGVSTSEAYRWLDDTAGPPPMEPRLWHPAELSGWPALASLAHNDFEPVVAGRHPEIDAMVGELRALGASPAMMSGSGSAVFGVGPASASMSIDSDHARAILTQTAISVEDVAVSA
jgi:4-diphosphocytidyl-2-C-methyl-D-erythritol kinase